MQMLFLLHWEKGLQTVVTIASFSTNSHNQIALHSSNYKLSGLRYAFTLCSDTTMSVSINTNLHLPVYNCHSESFHGHVDPAWNTIIILLLLRHAVFQTTGKLHTTDAKKPSISSPTRIIIIILYSYIFDCY